MTDERFKEKDTITVVGPRGGKRVEHLDYRARAIANAAYALALSEVDGAAERCPKVGVLWQTLEIHTADGEWMIAGSSGDRHPSCTAAIFAATKGETPND